MEKTKKLYPNPKFKTIEEEDKYWQTHSPLTEGHSGTIQHKAQKRSSYLALRLSGDELTQLRDAAAKASIGPTTLARNMILQGLKSQNELLNRLESLEKKVASLRPAYIMDKTRKRK